MAALDWTLVNPRGIERDTQWRVWHAGRVTDLLPLPDGTVLAATPSGLWQIGAGIDSTPLNTANWMVADDDLDRALLALGPDGPWHLYALHTSKTRLWVTDPSAPNPLAAWRQLSLPDRAGMLWKLLVLRGDRRIVLSASQGLWWAPIPTGNTADLAWTQATSDECFGLAEVAPAGTVVVSKTGKGLFTGKWTQQGDLQLTGPQPANGYDDARTGPTAFAVWAQDGHTVYAAVGDGSVQAYANQGLYGFLSSTDAGQTWSLVPSPQVTNRTDGEHSLAKALGNFVVTNLCLDVSAAQAKTLALGGSWGLFLSHDGGASWQQHISGDDSPIQPAFIHPALHVDVKTVRFTPISGGERLYVSSDGGVVATDDLGATFVSLYNQLLPNLQTQDVAVHGAAPGIAAAHQDNGITHCYGHPQVTPWRPVAAGDGARVLFLASGDLLFATRFSPLFRGTWAAGTFVPDDNPVPIWGAGGVDPNGISHLGTYAPIVQPVPHPQRIGTLGQKPIMAVAGLGADVYGLFPAPTVKLPPGLPPDGLHWERLATLPLGTNVFTTAVDSSDGLTILAGASDGRVFRIDGNGGVVEVTPGGAASHPPSIAKLRVRSSGPRLNAYALTADHVFRLDNGTTTGNPGAWFPLPSAPDGWLLDLVVDWSAAPPNLVLAVLNEAAPVFLSIDGGMSWSPAADGLPGVSVNAFAQLNRDLYASTYGYALWRAKLPPPPLRWLPLWPPKWWWLAMWERLLPWPPPPWLGTH